MDMFYVGKGSELTLLSGMIGKRCKVLVARTAHQEIDISLQPTKLRCYSLQYLVIL